MSGAAGLTAASTAAFTIGFSAGFSAGLSAIGCEAAAFARSAAIVRKSSASAVAVRALG
jgi:hypothetical protein